MNEQFLFFVFYGFIMKNEEKNCSCGYFGFTLGNILIPIGVRCEDYNVRSHRIKSCLDGFKLLHFEAIQMTYQSILCSESDIYPMNFH